MGSFIWIREARDIGPEIQTTQKIVILELMTTKLIFSVNLLNAKVIKNFLRT
jgi:hypothetical protein